MSKLRVVRASWAVVGIGLLVLGCSSSDPKAKTEASGGTGNAAGDSGVANGGAFAASGAGGGSARGGASSQGGTGGTAGASVSSNPLCPAKGPVVKGATPFADGVEVVSTENDARFLVVSEQFVYWANNNVIKRLSVENNSVETVVDRSKTSFKIQGLAVDETNVYFSESGASAVAPGPLGVAKAPLDGKSEPISLANEGPGATASSMAGITVAAGYVYYLNLRTQEFARVSVDGGEPTIIVRTVNPSMMTVAGGFLWFMHPRTNTIDNVHLLRVPIDAVAPPADTPSSAINVPPGAEVIAPVFNYQPTAVSADATHVYYDDENKVMQVPIAGGTPEIIAQAADTDGFVGSKNTTYVGYIVPTKSGVFWDADSGGCVPVWKSALDGSSTEVAVQTVNYPALLGANATHLYFSASGQILRVPL